jgi:hypothetical protein
MGHLISVIPTIPTGSLIWIPGSGRVINKLIDYPDEALNNLFET